MLAVPRLHSVESCQSFLTFNNLLFLLKEMTVIFLTVVAHEQVM